MWGLIIKGGPLMFLILLCSVIALAVFLERMWRLYQSRINTEEFMEDIAETLKRNKIMEAIDR
ncbi:MAG: MotA/TolQ/ExbB proton channel family protein, partial [Candidatus Omnitrophota bacterium]